jgi:hypothetical protein
MHFRIASDNRIQHNDCISSKNVQIYYPIACLFPSLSYCRSLDARCSGMKEYVQLTSHINIFLLMLVSMQRYYNAILNTAGTCRF